MSRTAKSRIICRLPQTREFIPANEEKCDRKNPVILTIDEYEAIRLIDREGLTQEQACQSMQVARTTVQRVYDNARKKLATALVDGLPLKIEGGEYRLCNGWNPLCSVDDCFKQEIYQTFQKAKGEAIMRIAVTYENGQVYQHFGHTEYFKVYDVEDGKILSSEVISTNGKGHGALAEVLKALKTDVLICGGIGGGAQTALASAGIQLYGGVAGLADDAVNALLAGTLDYVPNIQCSSHGDGHHAGNCGGHGNHDSEEGHERRHGQCGN